MTTALDRSIVRTILRVRLGQQIVNERSKAGEFRVPVHLAFGHEALAAGVCSAMTPDDYLLLSHRNMHYHLARGASLRAEIEEYLGLPTGLAGGQLGSMNLAHAGYGVPYTSSILGNNLPVAAGLAMASRRRASTGVVFVVTGDGAIEEGAFYESLVLARTLALPVVVVVENNDWSLATRVAERRCPISLSAVAAAVGLEYVQVNGASPIDCSSRFRDVREATSRRVQPVVVEAMLTTLGHWTLVNERHPDGVFVNYHAGPARTVSLDAGPMIAASESDPVFWLARLVGETALAAEAAAIRRTLEGEWA